MQTKTARYDENQATVQDMSGNLSWPKDGAEGLRVRYLPPPEPPRPHPRPVVLPVFIPFAGCPGRCVYCAQHLQTRREPMAHLAEIRCALDAVLSAAERAGRQGAELAFYGGTFTLLPPAWQEELLTRLAPWRERGVIAAVRCSTRPDAVPAETLRRLKSLGLTGIELGVQSFADEVLARSGRNYTGQDARAACQRVREHGFILGVQLLPGMPGATPELFAADVDACLALAPDLTRLYPCLVLRDTPLAATWAAGGYRPWSLELTVELLARAVLKFQKARIRVARLGLPLGEGFANDVLAGPVHPALGDMVRGLALHYWLREQAQSAPTRAVAGLCVPRAWQGVFWGHGAALKPAYVELGLRPDNVVFWDWPIFRLQWA